MRFSRPHTIFGTMVSVGSVSLMAFPAPNAMFFDMFARAVCSALCMNVAIVGLNQVYDRKIDMVNKPYLPLASGEFSASTALFIIAFSVLISLIIGVLSNSTPLLCTLISSLFFGLMYSVDIKMLRWKENPFLATSCILIVRALIVQLGFYCHALGSGLLGMEIKKNLIFSVSFMCIYSIVIALFKDIPDIMGDAQEGIQTLSVRFGISITFQICLVLLTFAYSCGALFSKFCTSDLNFYVTAFGHAIGGFTVLFKAAQVDLKSSASLHKFYMLIWKLFYIEYFLFPFLS